MNIKQFVRDGRIVILVILSIYLLLFYVIYSKQNYTDTIGLMFNVPVLQPSFIDLHVIRAAYESTKAGLNPYENNPYDPFKRKYNYPPFWVNIVGPALDNKTIYITGFIFIALFFPFVFKFLGRLTISEGVIAGFTLISPVTFLLLERGNIDIILFLLVILSLPLFYKEYPYKGVVTGLFISLCTIMKLYPILYIMRVDKEKKTYLISLLVVSVMVAVYLLSISPYIIDISENTPRYINRSYGCAILPAIIMEFIHGSLRNVLISPYKVGVSLQAILIVAVYFVARKSVVDITTKSGYKLAAFQLGSAIYIGSFALGYNWDYRLVFLLLLLPQIFEWHRNAQYSSKMKVLSGCILLQFNWMMLSSEHEYRTLFINESISWIILSYLVYFMYITQPAWVKNLIFNKKYLTPTT